MGDEVLVVDSESTARAIVAQRKKQLEVRELEKQVHERCCPAACPPFSRNACRVRVAFTN